ncbi:MAG: cupin [Microbacteriaceae bacterium]|nr:cupin [Microbacteriaceae bacterium]
MHHKTHIDEAAGMVLREYLGQSSGFRSQSLIDASHGAVHMRVLHNVLDPGGSVAQHVHSYEESFFVLSGDPVLILDGVRFQLHPGSTGVVPIGRTHGWIAATGVSRWVETDSPMPRENMSGVDTYFVASVSSGDEARDIDVRDPRNRNLFQWLPEQNDLAALRQGAKEESNAASSSMSTAVYSYTGIAVKVLVNERLDAEAHTLLLVEFNDGAELHAHDHPFEELYFILEGTTEMHADGESYSLSTGDVVWTGVGTVHQFANISGRRVRFLEPQAPQPPRQHAYRFAREWSHLASELSTAASGSLH